MLMTLLYACGGAAVSINEPGNAPIFSAGGGGGPIVPVSNPGNPPGTHPDRSCITTFSIATQVEGPGNLAEPFLLVQPNFNSFLVRQSTNCPFPVLQALPAKYHVFFYHKGNLQTLESTQNTETPDYFLMFFINEIGLRGTLKTLSKEKMEFSVSMDGFVYKQPTCAFRFSIETATLKSPGSSAEKVVSVELGATATITLEDQVDLQNCAALLRP